MVQGEWILLMVWPLCLRMTRDMVLTMLVLPPLGNIVGAGNNNVGTGNNRYQKKDRPSVLTTTFMVIPLKNAIRFMGLLLVISLVTSPNKSLILLLLIKHHFCPVKLTIHIKILVMLGILFKISTLSNTSN